jgi:hypothetical protein
MIAVIYNYSCTPRSGLDVNDIITDPYQIKSISIISFRSGIENDTIFFTNSPEEIKRFLQLFKVYEQTAESKDIVMKPDHVDGTMFINTTTNLDNLKIDYDGDCCYWFYYQNDTIKNLFTKELSEFLGGHYIEKHGYNKNIIR